MSLRDRLRSRRVGDESVGDESVGDGSGAATGRRDATDGHDAVQTSGTAAVDSALSGTVELTEFAPRQDGDYHCAERGLYLRFARPIVTETVNTEAGHTDAARGEFTTSGRFTVQRPFGRPIVYTILDDGHDAVLVVRRTDTGTREAARLDFVFERDEA